MTPKLDLIGLVVKDMAATLTFYRLLGLPIPDEAEKERHVEITIGGMRIAWDTQELVTGFDPSRTFLDGKGRLGLAFRCDSPADVDSFYATVTEAGYTGHKEPWDAFWGQRYAVIIDPDGNHIDLFADV
ncbi:MAG: VOC family protein [Chloroflexota bacterium]